MSEPVYILETQGQVIELTNIARKKLKPPTMVKRGKVIGFTKAARRRMINFISRFDLKAIRTVFMTLTFKQMPSYTEARRAFKQFTMRLRRANPLMSGVWRVELQKRGAVHYHLILFNLPYTAHSKLLESWRECTGDNGGGLNIKFVRNQAHCMAYLSKYVAKYDKRDQALFIQGAYQHTGEPSYEGRHWGWINAKELPFGRLSFAVVGDYDEIEYFVFAQWSKNNGRYPASWDHVTNYSKDAHGYILNAHERGLCRIIHRVTGGVANLQYRKDVYAKLRAGVIEAA